MGMWPTITELLPELRAYGRSISSSHADAEDLVSDAIERAVRSGSPPQSKRALKLWLFRIMRNLSIDGFRKARVQRDYLAGQERLVEEYRQSAPDLDDRLTLVEAMERLRPEERRVIFLIDVNGLTYAEAAAEMRVPIGTVMSRISRARRALIRELERSSQFSGASRRSGR